MTLALPEIPPLDLYDPTGLPSWPLMCLAGREGSGKSWACAEASGSPLVGRALWIPLGEYVPHEYKHVPGANFRFVRHDGTYRGILGACAAAAHAPTVNGLPNLLILDSGTVLWELLSNMAQAEANRRATAKAARFNRSAPEEDVTINHDLWNVAADRWTYVIDALSANAGPVIVTARLDEVTVMDEQGKPTPVKAQRIKTHKSFPYRAQVVVEMPSRGTVWLTKAVSVRLQIPEPVRFGRQFAVDALWRDLGLHELETTPREYTEPRWDARGEAPDEPHASIPGPRRHQTAHDERLEADVAKALAETKVEALRDMWSATPHKARALDVTAYLPGGVLEAAAEANVAPEQWTLGNLISACGQHVAEQGGLRLIDSALLGTDEEPPGADVDNNMVGAAA